MTSSQRLFTYSVPYPLSFPNSSGHLMLIGESWAKIMRPIWEQRDIDRKLVTGSENRDDYTMAVDEWLAFFGCI
jgi:hypothetical protein